MTDQANERLARIETKLDTALALQRDHEARVRILEAWKHYVLGVAAAVGGAASAAIQWLVK